MTLLQKARNHAISRGKLAMCKGEISERQVGLALERNNVRSYLSSMFIDAVRCPPESRADENKP